MNQNSVRLACAGFGSMLLALAAIHVRANGPARLDLLPIIIGVVMLVPAAFAERAVEEACLRFRNAAFVCFGAAIIVLMFVLTLRDRHGALAQQAASLGAACWLVAMMMTFCFAYYASKRRAVS